MIILNVNFYTDDPTVLQSKAATLADLDKVQKGLGSACVAAVKDLQARKLRPIKIVYKEGVVIAYGKASADGEAVDSAAQIVVR